MSRQPDLDKRAELLSGALSYFATHGIAGLSLRPLAAGLGTSDRMLIHYFGTKDNLIGQALIAAMPDLSSAVAGGEGDATDVARRIWQEMAGGSQQNRVRVMIEVMALSLTQPEPYRQIALNATHAWIDPIARRLQRDGAPAAEAAATATVLVSGLKGLALDLYVSRERERVEFAAERLIVAALL